MEAGRRVWTVVEQRKSQRVDDSINLPSGVRGSGTWGGGVITVGPRVGKEFIYDKERQFCIRKKKRQSTDD